MNEKIIEKKLRESIQRLDGLALKFTSPSFTGVPDRIVLMPGGRVWFVELKAPGKKIEKGSRQELVHEQLRGLGFDVKVISTPDQVQEFLKEVKA